MSQPTNSLRLSSTQVTQVMYELRRFEENGYHYDFTQTGRKVPDQLRVEELVHAILEIVLPKEEHPSAESNRPTEWRPGLNSSAVEAEKKRKGLDV